MNGPVNGFDGQTRVLLGCVRMCDDRMRGNRIEGAQQGFIDSGCIGRIR